MGPLAIPEGARKLPTSPGALSNTTRRKRLVWDNILKEALLQAMANNPPPRSRGSKQPEYDLDVLSEFIKLQTTRTVSKKQISSKLASLRNTVLPPHLGNTLDDTQSSTALNAVDNVPVTAGEVGLAFGPASYDTGGETMDCGSVSSPPATLFSLDSAIASALEAEDSALESENDAATVDNARNDTGYYFDADGNTVAQMPTDYPPHETGPNLSATTEVRYVGSPEAVKYEW
ncbi:hypothetical protein B0H14DRAFT_3510881 [Mycena olivaceomarginata]|nr:hypothetical protein B0H14DRAFT_3510881 [Mycena olivaceomarginata]